MSAIPAVFLDAFLAERAFDEDDDNAHSVDSVEAQRIYALYQGAAERARTCGELRGHDGQAAALLVVINEMENVLAGAYRSGGARDIAKKFEPGEISDLTKVLDTLKMLLVWHFENGAGALLPIAQWLNLAPKQVAA